MSVCEMRCQLSCQHVTLNMYAVCTLCQEGWCNNDHFYLEQRFNGKWKISKLILIPSRWLWGHSSENSIIWLTHFLAPRLHWAQTLSKQNETETKTKTQATGNETTRCSPSDKPPKTYTSNLYLNPNPKPKPKNALFRWSRLPAGGVYPPFHTGGLELWVD